jgi:hypothetical protein
MAYNNQFTCLYLFLRAPKGVFLYLLTIIIIYDIIK